MICFLATFCAVSLFFVALVKEPVGAYVLSVAFLFILLVLGWDVFSRFLKEIAPAYFIDILALYSPYSWLTRMSQGLVEYRALLSFLIVICSSLFFTRLVIGFKFRQNNSILKTHKNDFNHRFSLYFTNTNCVPVQGKSTNRGW